MFYPPLRLFDYTEELVEDVKNEFKQSFELFYCNRPFCKPYPIALEKLLK